MLYIISHLPNENDWVLIFNRTMQFIVHTLSHYTLSYCWYSHCNFYFSYLIYSLFEHYTFIWADVIIEHIIFQYHFLINTHRLCENYFKMNFFSLMHRLPTLYSPLACILFNAFYETWHFGFTLIMLMLSDLIGNHICVILIFMINYLYWWFPIIIITKCDMCV